MQEERIALSASRMRMPLEQLIQYTSPSLLRTSIFDI